MGSFEIRNGFDGQVFAELVSDKGETLLFTEKWESVSGLYHCIHAIKSSVQASRSFFEMRQANDGAWGFSLRAKNGQIVGRSPLFPDKEFAENACFEVEAAVKSIFQSESPKLEQNTADCTLRRTDVKDLDVDQLTFLLKLLDEAQSNAIQVREKVKIALKKLK